MAEEKDIALLADNDIIVDVEVEESPTVVIETTSTTTADISGDSAIGIVVGALDTLSKEQTLTDGIASIEGKFDNINIDLSPVAKEQTLIDKAEEIKQAVENGGGSGQLEEFWGVVPEDSDDIISDEDIHAAVEDIWNTTFNS